MLFPSWAEVDSFCCEPDFPWNLITFVTVLDTTGQRRWSFMCWIFTQERSQDEHVGKGWGGRNPCSQEAQLHLSPTASAGQAQWPLCLHGPSCVSLFGPKCPGPDLHPCGQPCEGGVTLRQVALCWWVSPCVCWLEKSPRECGSHSPYHPAAQRVLRTTSSVLCGQSGQSWCQTLAGPVRADRRNSASIWGGGGRGKQNWQLHVPGGSRPAGQLSSLQRAGGVLWGSRTRPLCAQKPLLPWLAIGLEPPCPLVDVDSFLFLLLGFSPRTYFPVKSRPLLPPEDW